MDMNIFEYAGGYMLGRAGWRLLGCLPQLLLFLAFLAVLGWIIGP